MKRLKFNEATTGRRLRPGALLIIYINIVRGANRLWGESSVGRYVHGAKCPWGEMSVGRKVHKPLRVSVYVCGGRVDRRAMLTS